MTVPYWSPLRGRLRFWATRVASRLRWARVAAVEALQHRLWHAQDGAMTRLGWEIRRAGWLGLSREYRHPAVHGAALRASQVRCARP